MNLACPKEEAQEFPFAVPHEAEDVAGAEGFGGLTGVGLYPPAKIFAAPRGETMAAGGVPDELECAEQGEYLYRG